MDMSKLLATMKAKKADLKPKEKTIRAKPGTNRYVLLQGWRAGEEHVWFHEFGQHYIKDGAGQIQAVYPCADATYGKPCPVCAGLSSAMASADDKTIELLKEAKSKQSFVINVLELDGESPNDPQILEVGKGVFADLVSLMEDWGAQILDSDEPQVVTIERNGKGLNTKYSVQVSPKKMAMPRDAMSKRRNLDEFVAQASEEQEKRALGAIRTVAGLLPAGRDVPATTESEMSMAIAGRDISGERAAETARASSRLDADLEDLLGDLPQ